MERAANDIQIVGPNDRHRAKHDYRLNISSTAKDWARGLSPLLLGPVALYNGETAAVMENAWQFAAVYPDQLDINGQPDERYFQWAREGWSLGVALRHPRGKCASPAFYYWSGEKLGSVDARQKIYFPLYRDAVARSHAFVVLSARAADGDLTLVDFNGYDHDAEGMSLADVLLDSTRPLSHAFILKMMLRYGVDVTPETVIAKERRYVPAAVREEVIA